LPAIPRVAVAAFETPKGGGDRVHLGAVDLMPAIAPLERSAPGAVALALDGAEAGACGADRGLPVRLVAPALPRAVADVAWDGRLVLPGALEAIRGALETLGSEGLAAVAAALDRVRSAERSLEGARRELALLVAARWEDRADAFEFLHRDGFPGDGFLGSEDAWERIVEAAFEEG